MSTKFTTTTIEADLIDEFALTEQSPSTSVQRIVQFAGSQEERRSIHNRPLPESTASTFKTFVGHARIQSSLAAVKGRQFFLNEWQDEGELDRPKDVRGMEARRKRNAAAIALLDKWLSDDTGYDEETWPDLKKAIERSRTSSRRRFSD